MESTSLYRKYRPQNFDEAIGQEGIVRILRNMISSGNIPHALLFTGTRGTGKTSFARIFAKAVNCLSPKNGSPCGECAACRAMANTSIDLMEIDAASNNGVDDIRALRESVVYPPADATLRYKVYIIDEVHQLTSAAFNAFLKTLEEPPAHCIFILATTEAQKLPATILSRCLRFDFRLYDQALLAEHVGKVFDKEGIRYTKDALTAIARAGNGSVRDTLSVADTCISASDGDVTYDVVLRVLGANDPLVIASLVEHILCGEMGQALAKVQSLADQGKNMQVLARDLGAYIRDLMIAKADSGAEAYLALPKELFARIKEIAAKVPQAVIVRAMGIFSGLDSTMRYASSPRFLLEQAIAKVCLNAGADEEVLLARIAQMEQKIVELSKRPVVAVSAPVQQEAVQAAPEAPTEVEVPVAESEAPTLVEGAVAVVSTLPDEDMLAAGGGLKLKAQFALAVEKKKLPMMMVIFTNPATNIYARESKLYITLAEAGDVEYCNGKLQLITEIAQGIMGVTPQIIIRQATKKQNFDDSAALVELFGASKVTKK